MVIWPESRNKLRCDCVGNAKVTANPKVCAKTIQFRVDRQFFLDD